MSLKLMFITNDEAIASIAESSGVDYIFIDLEINGKEKRQGHLDTVISRHNIDDIKRIKMTLKKSKLLVRVNPIYDDSRVEIENVIANGSDIIMLPFFKTKEEVQQFINYVNGRARTCLLVETAEAVDNIDDILSVEGIDLIHIGLNDLHLSYHMKFMFELLANGTVDMLCDKIRNKGITYGFGGIAQLGCGDLPAEFIIAEHFRLESKMAILSRSFCDTTKITNMDDVREMFQTGINQIRDFESRLREVKSDFFTKNHHIVRDIVFDITSRLNMGIAT